MSLSREAKVIVSVIRSLNELVEKGFLERGPWKVNETDELKKEMEGFEPTKEEIQSAMAFLEEEAYVRLDNDTSNQ